MARVPGKIDPSEGTARRVLTLLDSLGIDRSSFLGFLEWALTEDLISSLVRDPVASEAAKLGPLGPFRDCLESVTARKWSPHDIDALRGRVRSDLTRHDRRPIEYGEFLKLLWQVSHECAACHRAPPDVKLHIDHVTPAAKGGSSKRHNLQFLCAEHNQAKSDKRQVEDQWRDSL